MSISDDVRTYIERNPHLMRALNEDIVNYSALARKIMGDTGLENFQAIVAALKRYRAPASEIDHSAILARSSVEMYTNISVIILKPKNENVKMVLNNADRSTLNYSRFRIIQGVQGAVVVVNDNDLERMIRGIPKAEIISIDRKLAEIVITSPQTITYTRGYVAHLSSLLAYHGINVVQLVSFYTDVTFILDEKDLTASFRIISDLIQRSARQRGENIDRM
ncbi:conserved hypothetical protein [Thermoplasma acidophilum]|uniref:ACT domain-containing protein n=1 Tax=Thermoplasma acidophilum (strain ATCC 25905 / DSM 1728 / JCM 9062 / NBRC 15155 / AMRC-C165) TaxID=273075 RepID=Q9HL80_THEAC|nr:aspartokinase [Thermoplasma acidophilum]MCY0852186.1 ACT domain-containing protein [Thermoplasma acidophilum]CAC11494.1 conserved hypothetical protein [Thermoplasma acidophilum]